MRALRLLTLLPLLIAACDTPPPEITLLFDRRAPDLTRHVFPTDLYRGSTTLDAFTEPQRAATPFIHQLATALIPAYAPTTRIRLPFTAAADTPAAWIDVASAQDAVHLFRVDTPTAIPVPLGEIRHAPRTNTLTVRPFGPFAPGRYTVAVTATLTTRAGDLVHPSADFTTTVTAGDPLTDADLAKIHSTIPTFPSRNGLIALFTFTISDEAASAPLLRRYVMGEHPVDLDGADHTLAITPFFPPSTREIAALGLPLAPDPAAVTSLLKDYGVADIPHDAIGSISAGAISTPVFLSDSIADPQRLWTNSTFQARDITTPFSDSNPLSLSHTTPFRSVPYLLILPKDAPPTVPIILAIHGVTRSKLDWVAFANTACASGHGLIAIDLYQHGDRQDEVSPPDGDFYTKEDEALAELGVSFTDPFLNPTFLARTRDKLRQSLVDQLAVLRLLTAGDGTNPLIDLNLDGSPDHYSAIRVVAISLGAMLATPLVAISPEIDRAILSVPAAHLAEVMADSPEFGRDLSLLMFMTANLDPFGLLANSPDTLPPDSPVRELFDAVADTLLGSIDPATYAPHLLTRDLGGATPRLLIQLVAGDEVVTQQGSTRYAQALASGATAKTPVFALAPLLFDLGIPSSLLEVGAPLPPRVISEHAATHGMLLDAEDDADATAAAQAQAARFLTQP